MTEVACLRAGLNASGLLFASISALGFSTLPIFGKIAYSAGGNPATVLAVRFAIAAALLWACAALARSPLPKRDVLLKLFFMGSVGYATMSLLFLSAVQHDRISPSLASMLLYTYPALVTLLAWRVDGQRLTLPQTGALVGALAGTAVVLLGATGSGGARPSGVLFALGAALTYACYIVVGNRIVRQVSPLVTTAMVCTGAATAFGIGGWLTGALVPMAPAGWWAAVGTAVLATVVAILCFFMGLERLGPSRTSIISTLEPVGTVMWSALVFGESLSLVQGAGTAIVLGSIIALQYQKDG